MTDNIHTNTEAKYIAVCGHGSRGIWRCYPNDPFVYDAGKAIDGKHVSLKDVCDPFCIPQDFMGPSGLVGMQHEGYDSLDKLTKSVAKFGVRPVQLTDKPQAWQLGH